MRDLLTPNVTRLTKELDRVFSIYIRLSYSKKHKVKCYTCDHVGHMKKMQAGHYISRFYKATRWDERNVRPQCMMCNLFKKGNPIIFRFKLVEEYGLPVVEEMEQSVHKLVRGGVSKDYLVNWINYYQKAVDNLLTTKP